MNKLDKGSLNINLIFPRTLYSQSSASVTMGSLASFLRKQGFQVDLLLFDHDNNDKETGLSLFEDKHSIVIAKPNFKGMEQITSFLRGLKKDGIVNRVFFCGPFAKMNAHKIMRDLDWLDGVIIDQVESSAGLLLESMSPDLSNWNFSVPGSLSRDTTTNKIGVYTPLSTPAPLNDLPFPARDIEEREEGRYINIEASRGCLFNCSFCHVPLVEKRPVTQQGLDARDPVLVVDEIESLHKNLSKTLFVFNDSCFWSNSKDNERILRFCSEVEKRKLDVRFYIYLRCQPFIETHVLESLVNVGLVRVFLGVENYAPSSLKVYTKVIPEDFYESIKKILSRYKVVTHIGYITFEPYSSLGNILINIQYLYRVGQLFRLGVVLEPVRVIPNSGLQKQLVHDGLMPALDTLGYREITYGYHFKNHAVGILLARFKNMFEVNLRDVAHTFEYYCTTGELLQVLVERRDQKLATLLGNQYEILNSKKGLAMKLLLEYFEASIGLAEKNMQHLIDDVSYNCKFIADFSDVTRTIMAVYTEIISLVAKNNGEEIVEEVYPD